MNAAGALGGALAGPVLSTLGYSGLGLSVTALVGLVLAWTAVRTVQGRRLNDSTAAQAAARQPGRR
jgi:predicted MFS family arabinose efflux permease